MLLCCDIAFQWNLDRLHPNAIMSLLANLLLNNLCKPLPINPLLNLPLIRDCIFLFRAHVSRTLVFSDYNTFFLRSLITQSIRIPLVHILVKTGGRKLSLIYCFSVRAMQSCVACLWGYLIPTPYPYWFLQDSVSITRAVGCLFSVHETFLQRARWKSRCSET